MGEGTGRVQTQNQQIFLPILWRCVRLRQSRPTKRAEVVIRMRGVHRAGFPGGYFVILKTGLVTVAQGRHGCRREVERWVIST